MRSLDGEGGVGGCSRSVPPFRLKRWAVPAFLIIATVRGFLLNFGVYYAARAAIGLKEFTWSPAIACASPHPLQPQAAHPARDPLQTLPLPLEMRACARPTLLCPCCRCGVRHVGLQPFVRSAACE